MNMGINEIYDLLKKYRERQCTLEEEEQIVRWYEQFDDEVEKLPEIPEGKREQLWFSIKRKIQTPWKLRMVMFYRYTAAIIILAMIGSVGIYFWGAREQERQVPVRQEILPAQGVAVLQLSDGREVALSSTTVIKEQEGVIIENDSSKVLNYTLTTVKSEPLYNTITVPAGGEFSVLLSDGSSVHLNSCSSLTYPVPFMGDVREVKLSGEAYFDVTKSDRPFIVKMEDIDVRVLGTSFNLSGYTTDQNVSVTLVSGKVAIRDHQLQRDFNVTPGMRFEYNRESQQVKMWEVDPELYISWMKGKFRFEDMRLEDIMVTLNRWYDCTITYSDNTLRDLRFTGAAEKDRPASYLLELIEMITEVKFQIDGKHILITRK
jgi:putative anti-sigma factor